jgi:hypothetical protein
LVIVLQGFFQFWYARPAAAAGLALALYLAQGLTALLFQLLDSPIVYAETKTDDHESLPPKFPLSSAFILQILRITFNIN